MDQLVELLVQLVGKLKDDDLADPVMAGLLSQLIQVLNPEPPPFPPQLAEELQHIPDKIDRFRQAATALSITDPAKLKELVAAMKGAGIWDQK